MAEKTNSGNKSSKNTGTNYGGGYGKVHIVHDSPTYQGSLPTTSKTPPPPKTIQQKIEIT